MIRRPPRPTRTYTLFPYPTVVRSRKHNRRFSVLARLFKPVAALQYIILPAIVLARDLRDRAGGQAQIDRTAIRPLHMIERPGHHQRKLVGIGRIEIGKVGLAHADQRRIDRLVRAALGCQRDARRRADQQETRILVTAIVRSEEHTSELQSLMRISYAVFCLKKKNNKRT